MGQYHTIINTTKNERIDFSGSKLWEKAHCPIASMALLVLMSNSNGRGGGDLCNPIIQDFDSFVDPSKRAKYTNFKGTKFTKKEFLKAQKALESISGRWAGDSIVVQGDYAEKGDTAFVSEEIPIKDITQLVKKAFTVLAEATGNVKYIEKVKAS